MKRVLKALPVLVFSVTCMQLEKSYAKGEESELFTPSSYYSSKRGRVLSQVVSSYLSVSSLSVYRALVISGISLGAGFGIGYSVKASEHSNPEGSYTADTAESMHSPDKYNHTGNSSAECTHNQSGHAMPLVPEDYQQSIIQQYKLIRFDISDDTHNSDTKKKPGYLWARATFLDARPQHLDQDDIRPALFPLNSGFDPAFPYGRAKQLCTSPLPEPFTKDLRCNDNELTGFCRIKFLQDDGEFGTLVGMLANTPDAYSGCLLSSRESDRFLESLGAETLVPRDILVTDREYYQINVFTKKVSYEFQDQPRKQIPFASTVLLSGSLRHETLCKNDGSPGTQWYTDGVAGDGYGCAGLTPYGDELGDISYFVPVRLKASAVRRSAVTWQEVPSEKWQAPANEEVKEYFCSPRKPFKEFILGSVGGERGRKFCRYIDTTGENGFVATTKRGRIASDYLTPHIDKNVGWEAFAGNLPEKAVIAGFSFSNPNKVSTDPVYFCRFTNNGFSTYGKYFEKGKVCKSSFATPGGNSHALVDSKNFEILVTQ